MLFVGNSRHSCRTRLVGITCLMPTHSVSDHGSGRDMTHEEGEYTLPVQCLTENTDDNMPIASADRVTDP
jgi:hypothetical protein